MPWERWGSYFEQFACFDQSAAQPYFDKPSQMGRRISAFSVSTTRQDLMLSQIMKTYYVGCYSALCVRHYVKWCGKNRIHFCSCKVNLESWVERFRRFAESCLGGRVINNVWICDLLLVSIFCKGSVCFVVVLCVSYVFYDLACFQWFSNSLMSSGFP